MSDLPTFEEMRSNASTPCSVTWRTSSAPTGREGKGPTQEQGSAKAEAGTYIRLAKAELDRAAR